MGSAEWDRPNWVAQARPYGSGHMLGCIGWAIWGGPYGVGRAGWAVWGRPCGLGRVS